MNNHEVERVEMILRAAATEKKSHGVRIRADDWKGDASVCIVGAALPESAFMLADPAVAAAKILGIDEADVNAIVCGFDTDDGAGEWEKLGARLRDCIDYDQPIDAEEL